MKRDAPGGACRMLGGTLHSRIGQRRRAMRDHSAATSGRRRVDSPATRCQCPLTSVTCYSPFNRKSSVPRLFLFFVFFSCFVLFLSLWPEARSMFERVVAASDGVGRRRGAISGRATSIRARQQSEARFTHGARVLSGEQRRPRRPPVSGRFSWLLMALGSSGSDSAISERRPSR